MAPISIDETSESNRLVNSIIPDEITISEYIYYRISQTGLSSVFGVPGDFNLSLLEHIYDVKSLNWVGCCNELNAAYAADAYAKASQHMAALITTYGVGELSAINGIAGSYAEFAPVLHIVGTSSLADKRNPVAKNLHHLVPSEKLYNKPDHYIYEEIATKFACKIASLKDDPLEACNMVDQTIEAVCQQSRPGYIFLPCDLAEMKVPTERLTGRPLQLENVLCNQQKASVVANKILDAIYSSNNACIVADSFISKFKMNGAFNKLVDLVGNRLNLAETYMGRGLVSESLERYLGTYMGKLTPQVTSAVESSDLIISVGSFDNEMNYGFFSMKDADIQLQPQLVKVGNEVYYDLTMMDVLPLIVARLDQSRVSPATKHQLVPSGLEKKSGVPLSEADLAKYLENTLQPNDILVMETCSFMLAVPRMRMNGARILSMCFWGSIGYALPATLGASLALRDFHLPGRVFTVEGDGSAQMTVQELGTILRNNVDATMIITNNEGYTIERAINGPHSSYNDICPNWKWSLLCKVFGDPDSSVSKSQMISTVEELDNVVLDESKFNLLELKLDKFDIPTGL